LSNRVINVSVNDTHISAIGGSLGASGSGNATTLRLTFDEHWDGASKTVYFMDSTGSYVTSVLLGVDNAVGESTHEIDIPFGVLNIPGQARLSIQGVTLNADDNTIVDRTITTETRIFEVLDFGINLSAVSEEEVPDPSEVQQLQSAIDALAAGYQKLLHGENNPNAATDGGMGQLYIKSADNSIWICTGVSGTVHTWKKFTPDFVMDDTPTAQSNNAVTSNGIRLYVTNSIETAIGAIASSINTINGEDV
jgi:hypothetical protein